MHKLKNYLRPLTYKSYLTAMVGIWLIAFAIGIWLGEAVTKLALPAFIIGMFVHGVSMHKAHKQPH